MPQLPLHASPTTSIPLITDTVLIKLRIFNFPKNIENTYKHKYSHIQQASCLFGAIHITYVGYNV